MAHSRSGRRADLRWTLGTTSFLALAAGNSSDTVVSAGTTSQTIMRVRGEILSWLDGTLGPGAAIIVALGLLIQQAGATATSLPLTDGEAPFMMYHVWHLAYEEQVTDVIGSPFAAAVRIEVDVKSKRILRPDQEIVAVIEAATIANAAPANTAFAGRFLIAD